MSRFIPSESSWSHKFRLAGRGIVWAVRTQRNFMVHLAAAAIVIVVGTLLGHSLIEWCVLVLCIASVLAAEIFNTALEHLARAITPDQNDDIRHALDAAAGAVLVAAIGAAVAGSAIFVYRLGHALGSWSG